MCDHWKVPNAIQCGLATLGVLVGTVFVNLSTAGASVPASPPTQIRYVAAVDRSGGPLPLDHVVKIAHGGFCEDSALVPGHVYRCFLGNLVAEPCWHAVSQSLPANTVLCLPRPWLHDVLEIEAGHLPPAPTYATDLSHPWGVELSDGQRCLEVNGAGGRFEGRPVDYGCTGTQNSLVGEADRSGPVWTFQSVTIKGSRIQIGQTVGVRTAWF